MSVEFLNFGGKDHFGLVIEIGGKRAGSLIDPSFGGWQALFYFKYVDEHYIDADDLRAIANKLDELNES